MLFKLFKSRKEEEVVKNYDEVITSTYSNFYTELYANCKQLFDKQSNEYLFNFTSQEREDEYILSFLGISKMDYYGEVISDVERNEILQRIKNNNGNITYQKIIYSDGRVFIKAIVDMYLIRFDHIL